MMATSTGPQTFTISFIPGSYASLAWEPFRKGIEIHPLYRHPDGGAAALLRYAPNAVLPRHTHVGREQILILEGSQIDDLGEHFAGTLLVHPPGTSHGIRTVQGCVVLAIWEKPVLFDAD